MRPGNSLQNKTLTLPELQRRLAQWRLLGKTVAFTNGCFDLLHAGHIASFIEASQHADFLVVAVNADATIRQLKGKNRPIHSEQARAQVVAALAVVDVVIIFSEPTPLELILAIQPDVLVKGGDYTLEEIVGAKEVTASGGKVVINPIVEGFSTTSIIQRIQTP